MDNNTEDVLEKIKKINKDIQDGLSQMSECALRIGQEKNERKKLFYSMYPEIKSNEIKNIMLEAYLSGYKYEYLSDPRFNEKQVRELYDAMRKKIDISLYANPDISADKMKLFTRAAESGIDISEYTAQAAVTDVRDLNERISSKRTSFAEKTADAVNRATANVQIKFTKEGQQR